MRESAFPAESADLQGLDKGECDFGRWISLSGDELIVGAPGDNAYYEQGCGDTGQTDIYVGSGASWTREAVLTDELNSTVNGTSSSTGQGEALGPLFFGSSVGIYGSTAVVGEPGGSCGEALVFGQRQDGTWQLTSRLSDPQGSEPAGNCSFGTSVGIDQSRILVGGGISAAWCSRLPRRAVGRRPRSFRLRRDARSTTARSVLTP